MKPCYVYRHYDSSGDLLYVGITYHLKSRTAKHRSSSHWASAIDRIEYELLPDRKIASDIERWAVANMRPRFNIQYTSEASKLKAAGLGTPDQLVAEAAIRRRERLRRLAKRKWGRREYATPAIAAAVRASAVERHAARNHDKAALLRRIVKRGYPSVSCPTCARAPGFLCRSMPGKNTRPAHKARKVYESRLKGEELWMVR